MLKKIFFFIFIFLLLLNIANAEMQTLGIFKKDTPILLTQICSNCSFVNISFVINQNSTILIKNKNMTKEANSYFYWLNESYTYSYGKYIVCGIGDLDGTITSWCYSFLVNDSGREDIREGTLILFLILFFIILLFSIPTFLLTTKNGLKMEYKTEDLGLNWSIFFFISAVFFLQSAFVGNDLINNISSYFFYASIFIHFVLPITLLVVSIIYNAIKIRRESLS